jgi:hypothetical protein
MNPRNYERLTTACLLLAVASALSFQASGRFSVLVGGLGILAGVVAAVVYLKNQLPSRSDTRPSDNCAQEVPPEREESVALSKKAITVCVEPGSGTKYPYVSVGLLADWSVHLVEAPEYDLKANDVCIPFYKTKSYQSHYGFRERSEPDAVVARVVEIMKRLSTEENMGPYECILSPDGNFTVRPMLNDESIRQDEALPSMRDDEEEVPHNLALPN